MDLILAPGQLIPRYRPLVKREPTVTGTIKEWSDDAVEKLKGTLELDCTDWDVFVDSSSDINELTEAVCGYIDFCAEYDNKDCPTARGR